MLVQSSGVGWSNSTQFLPLEVSTYSDVVLYKSHAPTPISSHLSAVLLAYERVMVNGTTLDLDHLPSLHTDGEDLLVALLQSVCVITMDSVRCNGLTRHIITVSFSWIRSWYVKKFVFPANIMSLVWQRDMAFSYLTITYRKGGL